MEHRTMTGNHTDARIADQLLRRIEQLEQQHERTSSSLRRMKMLCAAIAGVTIVGSSLAFNAAEPVDDLVRTKRIEVINDDGKLVAALSASNNNGQFDLWNSNGNNIVRASANEHGGDFNIWNRNGASAFGAYAGELGGEFGIWNMQSVSAVHAAPNAQGGTLSVKNAAGDNAIALNVQHNAGHLALHDQNNTPRITLGTDAGNAANIIASGTGTTRAHIAAGSEASVDVRKNNSSVAQLATTTNGGAIQVADSNGATAWTARVTDRGTGRMNMQLPDGTVTTTIEAVPNIGAILGLFNAKGTRQFIVGTPSEGGLLNLMDKNGNVVVTAGHSDAGVGGALSVRNRRGLQILHLGADEHESGLIRAWNADGEDPKALPKDR